MQKSSDFHIESIITSQQDTGEGTSAASHRVVFLHGLFGRGKNFTTLARELQPEAQSLLVDLPNHGGSDWTESFDYLQMADLVADHIREKFAGDEQIDLVGHSMGGKVAMVLALRHPDLVRRLVVLDISPTNPDKIRGEFPHLLSSLRGLDTTLVTKRNDAHEALREAIPSDTVRGFLLQNLIREGDSFSWEPNLNMLHRDLAAIMGFPDLHGDIFEGAVLWIGGGRSDYVTDEDEPEMRGYFPFTVRETIPDTGHWLHSEKPREVAELVRGFLLT